MQLDAGVALDAPVGPPVPSEEGMGDERDASTAADLVDRLLRLRGKAVGGRRETGGGEVRVLQRQLRPTDHQHVVDPARRRRGLAVGRAVVGEHDEVEARGRGGRRDLLEVAATVGEDRVHVEDAFAVRTRQRVAVFQRAEAQRGHEGDAEQEHGQKQDGDDGLLREPAADPHGAAGRLVLDHGATR
jgi:hypothetical protein